MVTRPRIAVVTDSSADLPDLWVEKAQIHVVPQLVVLNDERLAEGQDISRQEVYRYLREGRPIHLGHPTPDDFRVMFRKMAPEVTGIVVIAPSTFFNPTMVSAEVAAVTYRKVPALAVNSGLISAGVGLVALAAAQAASQASPLDDVANTARSARERVRLLFIGGDWNALRRHRHASKRTFWRQILGERPFITLTNGQPYIVGYGRGRHMWQQAVHWLEARLQDAPKQTIIVHAMAEQEAALLQHLVQEGWAVQEVPIVELTPLIAVRLGLETVGIALIE